MTVIGSATYLASSDEVRKLMFLVLALMNYAVIFAWIYAFYVRMQHSGKVCSGDFLEDSDSKEGFLVQQGMLLDALHFSNHIRRLLDKKLKKCEIRRA